MATSEQQDSSSDPSPAGSDAAVEAAARSVEQASSSSAAELDQVVTPAGDALASNTEELVVSDSEEPTRVSPPIPALLIDEPHAHSAPTPIAPETPGAKERIADAAAAVGEGSGERPARPGEGAAEASGRGGQPAGAAKEKAPNARKRFSAAASEAKERASNAGFSARERASNADVKEFAHSTTSLIATARPFFLAGCAAIFAVLGFLEGDAGTAQVFAVGALIFVIGAAFSVEINAFLASRSQTRAKAHRDDD